MSLSPNEPKKRILFLSAWLPYPTDNGSRIRIYNLLKGLASRYRVTLIAFRRDGEAVVAPPELYELCEQVELLPWRKYNPKSFKSLLGMFSLVPRSVMDTYSPEMAGTIRRVASAGDFCGVIISEFAMLPYTECIAQYPVLLEDIELGAQYEAFINAAGIEKFRRYFAWSKVKNYVSQKADQARICTAVSEREKMILTSFLDHSKHVEIIPNSVDYEAYQSIDDVVIPKSIIFTGSLEFLANAQAVEFFIDQIFPFIKRKVPDVLFQITGRTGDHPLPKRIHDPNIQFLGHVEDLKKQVAKSWLSVAPIKKGAGTRLKILESLAIGTPVVSTSKGAEGLELKDGEHIQIADTPEEFAAKTILLLNDPEKRLQFSVHGKRLVQEKYNWEINIQKFLDIVETSFS